MEWVVRIKDKAITPTPIQQSTVDEDTNEPLVALAGFSRWYKRSELVIVEAPNRSDVLTFPDVERMEVQPRVPVVYPHLTDAERSADARTLRRLLEEARAELEDYTSQAEAGGEQLLDRMLNAQCWSTRWKQAAKEHRKRADSHVDKLVTAMERLLALEAETARECIAIAIEHGVTDTAAAIRERFKVD